jgi:hypothetical protein
MRPSPGPARPRHQTDQPVHEDRAGCAGQRRGRSGQDQTQAFAEEPHPGHPEKRDDKGRANRAPEQQSCPDRHLNEGKEGVPDGNVRAHEVPDVGDDPPDDVRLSLCIVQEETGGEPTAEHVRLELQSGVQQPEQTEDDLERALGPHQGRRSAGAIDRRPGVLLLNVRHFGSCRHAPRLGTSGRKCEAAGDAR